MLNPVRYLAIFDSMSLVMVTIATVLGAPRDDCLSIMISVRKVGSGWWSPQQLAAEVGSSLGMALVLSILQFCLHQNQGQP